MLAVDAHRRELVDQDVAVHDCRPHVAAASGIDERRVGVGSRCEVRAIAIDDDEVGAPADFEGANLVLEPKRSGARTRGHPQHLTRGQNAECQKIPYLLRTDKTGAAQSVLLQKALGDQVEANFTLTTVWQPEPAVNPLPTTTIDYDGPGGTDPKAMVWCLGTTAAPAPVTGQAWCLTSQKVALVGGGKVQLTESYFGSGDPRWAR